MMVTIPIPKSWRRYGRELLAGSWVDRLWKLLVLTIAGVILVVLFAAGPPGWLTLIVIWLSLAYAIEEPLAKTLSDIWNRRFMEV